MKKVTLGTELLLLVTVFAELPHVLFCIKDEDGTYVAVNRAFARRCGQVRVGDVIGQRASDLFPIDLASSYDRQDRAVLSTGLAVLNHLEIITRADGEPGWFITTKLRVDSDAAPVVVVVSTDLNAPVSQDSALDDLSGLLNEVRGDPGRAWRVSQLAALVGIGERQLERRVQRVLGVTVKGFLQAERIGFAARLLSTSENTLSEVSATAGFYDQSQFTRQFRLATGLTPGQYRNL